MKNTYQQEMDNLLKTLLKYRFFNNWKAPNNSDIPTSLYNSAQLEIYLTNKCNQHCKYCYLYNNQEIYPKNIDDDTILQNLKILYNWIVENNFQIPKIEFFSGEIWDSYLGQQVLKITLEYLHKGMQIQEFIIPSNFSFIKNDESFYIIQNYINLFKDCGSLLKFSCSIDGKELDNINRQPNDSSKAMTDEYYDKIFNFCVANDFGFHPMVSSYGIEKWPKNFQWWKETCNKYGLDVHSEVMMLEVRDDNWTSDKIQKYLNFLEIVRDDFFENNLNKNIKKFTDFCIGNVEGIKSGYLPWVLSQAFTYMSCTASTQLAVRIGDLTICPCHRTAYDKYNYGKFVVNNGKIVDIISNNVYMAQRVLYSNQKLTHPKCDSCVYNSYCIRGCLGAQLEKYKDPFMPLNTVCDFEKAKIDWIISYYKNWGILDNLKKLTPKDLFYNRAYNIIKFIEAIDDEKENQKK